MLTLFPNIWTLPPFQWNYYQPPSCTSIIILQSQNLVRENFSPQLRRKAEQLGSLSKVLSAQAYIHLNIPLFQKTNLCRLHTFYKNQPNSCHQALLIRSDPKIVNRQDCHFSNRLQTRNEESPSTMTQEKTKTEKSDALSVIILTPEKKIFTKKYRRTQEAHNAIGLVF